ncbi:hypothetical protein KKA85_08690 [bacterium]|nr:hypothetical protein [bacterium]MBU1675841.1 hypothetical protein [bacterium]
MRKRHATRILIVTLAAAAGFALLHGCALDRPFAPDDVAASATPASVLDALRNAYESMSLDAYANLLHRDFHFVFADPGKAPFDRGADLASTGRMFSGVAQKNSAGQDAPAVAGVAFARLEILGGWERVTGDEVTWSGEADVMRALIQYRFALRLERGGRICASGRQVVYAVAVETEDWDGSLYWRWQLLGQRDL